MERIKIISNPYNKEIIFETWHNEESNWKDIKDTNPNSKLLNQKIVNGFLPFVITNIVELIVDEYFAGKEKIEVVFEGNSDEFNEVKKVCEYEEYKNKVSLLKSDNYLENAREIQPGINDIFSNVIHPIIIQSEDYYQSEEELESIKQDNIKYDETITDVIPICVVGNYSSGKSSFINALIGKEILPSGTKPMTSRIHKIFETSEKDCATISFSINNNPVKISVSKKDCTINCEEKDNDLIKKLEGTLQDKEKQEIKLINSLLEIINCYVQDENVVISNTIEIGIEFANGLLKKSKKRFVILDTPGSNSESNENHKEVLEEALEGFSNGLPVFVSEVDSLDTTDNKELFDAINDIEALDNRFTLIVVNKADESSLPTTDEARDELLNQTVPKNLYSSGIYFVSSIMGLGYKINGSFRDSHALEIYTEKREKYINEESQYYKQLYKFNIAPKQLAQEKGKDIEKIDKLYLNSGLYSIESAIINFAEKYSSYDKCKQSKLFLDRMVEKTRNAISINKEKEEAYKEDLKKELEESKRRVLDNIDENDSIEFNRYNEDSIFIMKSISRDNDKSAGELEDVQKKYYETISLEKDLSTYETEFEESKKEIGANIKNNFKDFKNGKNVKDFFSNVGKVAKEAFSDTQESYESSKELKELKAEIKKESFDQLKNYMNEEFNNEFLKKKSYGIELSESFWSEKSNEFKEVLRKTISGSKDLDNEKKNELEQIIIQFEKIDLETPSDGIFKEKKLIIAGLNDFFEDILHIKFKNLADKYNDAVEEQIKNIREIVKKSHENNFIAWKNKLIKTIKDDILNYSPVLHEKQKKVDEQQLKIDKLKNKLDKLTIYSNQINEMLKWKKTI